MRGIAHSAKTTDDRPQTTGPRLKRPLPMNRVVARASRPCESKRTGETPVPLPPRRFGGSKHEVRLRRILTLPSLPMGERMADGRVKGMVAIKRWRQKQKTEG